MDGMLRYPCRIDNRLDGFAQTTLVADSPKHISSDVNRIWHVVRLMRTDTSWNSTPEKTTIAKDSKVFIAVEIGRNESRSWDDIVAVLLSLIWTLQQDYPQYTSRYSPPHWLSGLLIRQNNTRAELWQPQNSNSTVWDTTEGTAPCILSTLSNWTINPNTHVYGIHNR